ncbi:hypothetical protein D1010_07805 [Schleiferilactobacillus harbinensis]|uniref:Uncharacterized protein n=1 Tax=Schleiferilactobacillus harbinensis TaxID=304207 RepID=A0A5P8M498_9LACO|nr:hypothetical protein D1010_07805 [Schleiferilactobacillus harbinensis]
MRSKRRLRGLSGGNHTTALPSMWLGDLKTAVFAGVKRRHHVPAPSAGACGALARRIRKGVLSRSFSLRKDNDRW